MTKSFIPAAALILGLATVACGKAARTTETFTGTVTAQAPDSHTIAVAAEGEVDAMLSSTDPAVAVGLGIGQPAADGSCALLTTNTAATAGMTVSTEVQPGSYCVSVYDGGSFSGSVTYSVSVTHP